MTPETVPNNSARLWLPIPAQQVLYALSTDHYPWAEVWQDIALRREFTGVLEARTGKRRAQALWVGGELLGAYGHVDKTLEQFSLGFPRAFLRLYEADPNIIRVAWTQRSQAPQEVTQPWPQAAQQLSSSSFTGVLLGGLDLSAVSYWQGGKPVAGSPPPAGKVAVLGELTPLSSATLTEFWNQVLAYSARQEPALLRAWQSSAKALVNRHPCLDPFIKEVWLEGGRIHVTGTEVNELRPALRDVFLAAAQTVRFPVSTLQGTQLGSHPLWQISGLGRPGAAVGGAL